MSLHVQPFPQWLDTLISCVLCFQLGQIIVCGRVPWLYQYWPGGFMLFVVLCPGTPEGSTSSGSGFKASQKTGRRLKVSSDRLGEAGNRTCDPWFTRHRFIPYTTAASSTWANQIPAILDDIKLCKALNILKQKRYVRFSWYCIFLSS